MIREKGLAYCGLACCVCSQNETCAGCRNDGCKDREWCHNRKCCIKKGIRGCWECDRFPCGTGMLEKIRARVFAKFAARCGEDALLDRLEENEAAGMIYHYDGQLVGDYDASGTESGIVQLILYGKTSDNP